MLLRDEQQTTAYFTFSSQMRPSLHQFRIFGSENGLLLDEDEQVMVRLRGKRFKSYLQKFVPAALNAKEYCGNIVRNARHFLANDFHMKSGVKYLTEELYRSIREDGPAPIPYREILLTSRIMDEIFRQVDDRASGPPSRETGLTRVVSMASDIESPARRDQPVLEPKTT